MRPTDGPSLVNYGTTLEPVESVPFPRRTLQSLATFRNALAADSSQPLTDSSPDLPDSSLPVPDSSLFRSARLP